MDWKDFSAHHGHYLAHYLNLLDEADQARRIRAVLAGRPRKAAFFAPTLAALGRRLVKWGTRLQVCYDQTWEDSMKHLKEQQ